METAINYTDDTAYFSSDERKWCTKVRKLKALYPDKVRIIAEPETNDGCIYASLPAEWLKLTPKRVLSEEQKQILAQRARKCFSVSPVHREESMNFLQEGGSEGEDEYLST